MIISQLPVSAWHDLFKDNTYADACMESDTRGVSAGVQRQEHERSFKELNQLRQLTTSSLRSEAGSPFKPNHQSAQSETSEPLVRNSQSTWAKFTIISSST